MTYPLCWIRRRHESNARTLLQDWFYDEADGDLDVYAVCAECGITTDQQFGIVAADQWTGNPRAWEWVWFVEVEEVRR